MAQRAGEHARRVTSAAALLTPKGRKGGDRFLFEGETLLREARASGVEIEEVFATQDAFDESAEVRALDAHGTPVWIVAARTARRLSDVETPSGIVAVAKRAGHGLDEIMARPGVVLVLAGISDPGNAGTLLRSAEAFSAAGVVFAAGSVDAFHPKVVRAAMGSLFRIPIATCGPKALEQAARKAGRSIAGLSASAPARLGELRRESVLVVGAERRGLGPWKGLCESLFSIPIASKVESLNAAVAGSIALYQASLRSLE